MKSPAPALHIQGLSKAFGPHTVLQGLDLDVARGESFVLLGQSGSGKSVLLKCLVGLLAADAGVLMLDNQSIVGESRRDLYKRMNKIGMVFQGSALFDSLDVWQNVAFGALFNDKKSIPEARALADDKLLQVGLAPEVGHLRPSSLSGGMQRRVSLARAIALSPSFLFLDEPTAGLDPLFCRMIARLIQECRQALGATTLTITHDLHLARTIADRIGMLHQGTLVWQGTAAQLDTCDHPVVREFVGIA